MTDDHIAEDASPRTIRMFPDYADTVLWVREPIDYEDTGLSDGLVAELEAWEQFYYDSLDPDFTWVSNAAVRAYSAVGTRLAHRVADEVGPQFIVEFASRTESTEIVRARSDHRASNSGAESAFTQLFDEVEAEEREAAEFIRNNPGGEWVAYAPLSGTVFKPNPSRQAETASDED
ncbi:hypothetical protein [Brevibacterium sp. CFH 10365]|uniref:hypothetical protein n=1 Tax=Brevibacterium sp. CFH 10365 TaxID=2585207 RepID=UPI0012668373|nr:hypothetical protein [Brevibacterium sp. CFH 10365]